MLRMRVAHYLGFDYEIPQATDENLDEQEELLQAELARIRRRKEARAAASTATTSSTSVTASTATASSNSVPAPTAVTIPN
eukprot:scaffold2204_cov166-Amphora_coffeaeformis.AAC.30